MKEPIRELRCHYLVTCVYIFTPLTKRGLVDENSVSSQIFLILFSLITPLVQKAKLNFCIQAMSKKY